VAADLVLRSATDADVSAVLEFWSAAAENTDRPADTAAALHALLIRDPDALILAVDGDRIVGSLIGGWDGWRCHLYRLAVDPRCRRRGIARSLIGAAEDRFREAGAGRVDAMVLDENSSARGLWESAGYHRQPQWSRWIKPLR
jgi:ribosomal protein S18 acetylase RimI-like enzyme